MKKLLVLILSAMLGLAAFAQQPQPIEVASYQQRSIDFTFDNQNGNPHIWEETITTQDASFIKVHFDYFNLPEGVVLEVSNPSGTEVYRYSNSNRDSFTWDESLGHDGMSSFSSMSISGNTAVIRLEVKGKPLNNRGQYYGVHVTTYSQGFPNDYIEGVFGEALPVDVESTCSGNQRYDAACYEQSHPTEFERSHAVARLLMGNSLCTTWRVSDDNRMMTNNHCTSTASGVASSEAWFNYQYTSCNGNQLGSTTKVSGDQLLATDYTLDYTLFTVNNFSSIQSFGNLGLDVRMPIQDEEIYIPQHGSGNPKELAIESDANAGNICRIDVVSAYGRAAGTDTGYYCDTIGGSSGSPVLARSSHKVIALHHFGGCPNQGVLIDKIWPQISGFFPNGIPQGSGSNNGGNNSPNAAFSSSANLLSVSFTDNSSDSDGSVVAWSWNFGDGNSSSAQNPNHTYAASGSYTVTLTVTDDQGASSSASQTVTVSDGSASLSASGYKDKGVHIVDLSWNGVSGASVDIYRNGSFLGSTANDGAFTDNTGNKGKGSYTYEVCGDTCTNTVTVNF